METAGKMDVAGKKILIIASWGPENVERCTAPFFFAQKAAALGGRVEICFIQHSALLLKRGVAEELCPKEDGRSVRDFIDLALQAGVEFHACDAALRMNSMTPDDLIAEVDSLVGPNYLITAGLGADLVLNM